MKRLSVFFVIGIAMLLVAPAYASVATVNAAAKAKPASPCDNTLERCTTPLIAGQFMEVGTVAVGEGPDSLVVTYEITDLNWAITAIHLEVSDEPITEWAPGQYDYVLENLATAFVEIPIPYNAGDCVYIAAHAVVTEVDHWNISLADFEANLPDQVAMKVAYPGPSSYFQTTVDGGSILDGTYTGWCIDVGHTISPGTWYNANVYSSYEDLSGVSGLNIDNPENLPLVNYIINTFHAGDPSMGGYGNYTLCDIQRAIWALIDDGMTTCGTYNQDRVDEIVAAANEYFLNFGIFYPQCGDVIAVILIPVNGQQITIAQVTVIEVPTTCEPVLGEGSETAWGCGVPIRENKNWGWYFHCCTD